MIDLSSALARLTAALADRYRIERELGAGGMATVYLAHDLKHDRDVALKVLRPELGAVIGAERFLAEIRTTANLHHPHILPLFDSGAADGFLFYVMPFTEGESLRDRLTREHQLPVDDAVRIATEIAGALDYAHRRGVIHRDIKPENILLHDGRALVADFGIALTASQADGARTAETGMSPGTAQYLSPELALGERAVRITETGMSLGTPLYMSPEQAMGERDVTARSDVYALGCVLYEMLVGEPPFTGPTAQAIVARVMTETPRPLLPKRHTIPSAVEAAVLTALEKLPANRFATAADFATALTIPAFTSAGSKRVAVLAGAGFVVAVLAVVVFWPRSRGPEITIGKSTQVTSDPGLEYDAAISPDGQFVAYAVDAAGGQRIMVRKVGGGAPAMIVRDGPQAQIVPLWSPDGQQLIFGSERGIEMVPAQGGPTTLLVPAPSRHGGWVSTTAGRVSIFPGPWSPNGLEFAYALGDSIFVRPVEGGGARAVAVVHDPHSLAWSPDGQWLAYVSGNSLARIPGSPYGNVASSAIGVVRAEGGAPIPVTSGDDIDGSPTWSATG